MIRGLRGQGRWLYVIAGFVLAAAASTYYILTQQKVVTPLAERYTLRAEFENTTGLEPGLTQPVNVAGVRVGTITAARLREGRSLITLSIDPGELPRVYRDASATLVPNTPLDDLALELTPGHPDAGVMPTGAEVPVTRTVPPGHLDELLAALDHDTRDYLQILLGETERGLRGRAGDLRALLATLRPTAVQLRRVTGALARRHTELQRAVGNLRLLTGAAARSDRDLTRLIDGTAGTVAALASQERALDDAVRRLPGTLHAARQVAGDTEFTRELRPALDALVPTAERLPDALRAAGPLARDAVPLLRDGLRPLAADARPLARDLGPLTRDLTAVTPHLSSTFSVLRHLGNELAANPPGSDEGYLFWSAWALHNLNSTLSTADAHGGLFRGFDILNCSALQQQPPFTQVMLTLTTAFPFC